MKMDLYNKTLKICLTCMWKLKRAEASSLVLKGSSRAGDKPYKSCSRISPIRQLCTLFQVKYNETYRKASRGMETSFFSCQEIQATFKAILIRGYRLIYSNAAKAFELNSKCMTSLK